MLLKRLELLGFKSFANRASLEFESGISCLVGPNGSGKSNVADAVRWVLGEQSARALRGKKAEEVIFVGSADRQPLGMAEVALVLDNSDGRLSLDYGEVRLARRLYRSGESEYLINGARARRKDLVSLLLEVGLHTAGYTVIGQGAVEELVIQRPEERRAVLEQAADITRHQGRLAEARFKLASTDQNLVRCEDLVAELEPHARRLRAQAERAERYGARRAELAAVAQAYYRAALAESSAAEQAASASLVQTSAEIGRLEAELADHERHRTIGREQVGVLERQANELRAELERRHAERATLLADTAASRQRVGFLEARLEALASDTERVGQIGRVLADGERRRTEAASKLGAAWAAAETLRPRVAAALEHEQALRGEHEVARASLTAIRQEAQEQEAPRHGANGASPASLGSSLAVEPEYELAVTAALGEWALARLVNNPAGALSSRPGAPNGRSLFLTLAPYRNGHETSESSFKALLGEKLADIWHRPAIELFESSNGSAPVPLGPLAFTVIVRDLADARLAAERLEAGADCSWQISTLNGQVITHYGGWAQGAEAAPGRLVSLRRRQAEAGSRMAKLEDSLERANHERTTLQAELAAAQEEERAAQSAHLALEAETQALVRWREELLADIERFGASGEGAEALRGSETLEGELEELRAELEEQNSRASQLAAAVEAKAAQLHGLGASRAERQAEFDGLDAAAAELRQLASRTQSAREAALLARQRAADELTRLRQEAEATAEEWGLPSQGWVQLRMPVEGSALVQPTNRRSPTSAPLAGGGAEIEIDLPGTRRRLVSLQRELRAYGATSESVLEQYREVQQRLDFLTGQSTDLRAAMAELEDAIAELEELMRSSFVNAFVRVNEAFEKTFATLFGGGTARLELIDPADPLQTGVDIVAQPPGKRLQNVMSLSGGERALTSTALIFALLSTNPLPFCVLDEVDAALDESNARRFADLLEEYAKRTQFIVITHNRVTMETANSLYGISMGGDGVTTVVSLRPQEAVEAHRSRQTANGSQTVLQA